MNAMEGICQPSWRHRSFRKQQTKSNKGRNVRIQPVQPDRLLTSANRLDLVSAVNNNKPPRFPSLGSTLPILPPLTMTDMTILKEPSSPLHSYYFLNTILHGSESCEKGVAILQCIQNLTTHVLTQPSRRITKRPELLSDPGLGAP
jgi:hypothetical protein